MPAYLPLRFCDLVGRPSAGLILQVAASKLEQTRNREARPDVASRSLRAKRRAYRELEIREILTTQQGIGTFISNRKLKANEAERHRRLSQLVGEFLARGGADGFTLQELLDGLKEVSTESDRRT